MPVSYLNTLEPVLAPYPQRASAGIAELSDRIGGVSFAFDVQVHGPVALLLAVPCHKGGLLPVGGSKKTSPPRNPKRLFDTSCSYPLTHDFAATICGFLILVDSPSVRNAAKLKMKDFLQRLTNALLNATFVF